MGESVSIAVIQLGLVVHPDGNMVACVKVRQHGLAGLPHPRAVGQVLKLVVPGIQQQTSNP